MAHRYGEWFERESNILRGKYDLSRIAHLPEAHHLIERMLRLDPARRPTAAEVEQHPFFWNDKLRMDFLQELSDILEREEEGSRVLCALEAHAKRVVGAGWDRKLPVELIEDMAKYRRYKFQSLADLLRLIRNKRHHYGELPDALQNEIGFSPASFVRYFTSRFPQLFMACYDVACTTLAHVPVVARLIGPEATRRYRPVALAAQQAEDAAKARLAAMTQAVATARAAGATSGVMAVPDAHARSASASASLPADARAATPASRLKAGGRASMTTPGGGSKVAAGGGGGGGKRRGRGHAKTSTSASAPLATASQQATHRPGALCRAWYVSVGTWLTAGGPANALSAATMDGDPMADRQVTQRTNYAGGAHMDDPRYKTKVR